MRIPVLAVTSVALVLTLAGCGGDDYPSYGKDKACGVPTKRLVDVLGTDQFHTRTKGGPLPVTTQPSFQCNVDLSEEKRDVVSVTAGAVSSDTAESTRRVIAGADEKFTVSEGQVGITRSGTSFKGYWLCGTMSAYVDASPDRKTTADQRQALLTALAEAAGCGA
jgi:hypothetical protein